MQRILFARLDLIDFAGPGKARAPDLKGRNCFAKSYFV